MYKLSKINWNKVLGVDYYYIKELNQLQQIYAIIKAFFGAAIRNYATSIKESQTDFLFVKMQDRDDYNNLYSTIYSQCLYDKLDFKIEYKLSLNFYFIYFLIYNGRLYLELYKEYRFIESIFLYIKLIRYTQVLRIIKKIKYKHVVVFSDVQPIENLIVQYSNLHNISTQTLQHGLYVDYEAMPNINMLNYLEVSSKTLLAWGDSTKTLFEKYNDNINIKICGKPLEMKGTNPIEKFMGIVLDQPMFSLYNQRLLDIAHEIAKGKDLKIFIKVRPQDKLNNYNIDPKLILEEKEIKNADFILAHTTSMIYELLRVGSKVYKLYSNIPSNSIDSKLIFSSAEELVEKLNASKNLKFINEGKRHIAFIGAESQQKYKEFFDEIYLQYK
jgi:hypothetical protein